MGSKLSELSVLASVLVNGSGNEVGTAGGRSQRVGGRCLRLDGWPVKPAYRLVLLIKFFLLHGMFHSLM